MLFALHCLDKPGAAEVRKANRAAHLDYLAASDGVVMAGPLTGADGETMCGSILVVEAESRIAAEAWAAADPYAMAGLFERVEIHQWKVVVDHWKGE